jgi:hypothetical protein
MTGYDGSGVVPSYITERLPVTRSSKELLAVASVTRRQMDHWTIVGYIVPLNPDARQGTPRLWGAAEVAVAILMGKLTKVGFTVPAAAAYARAMVEGTASADVHAMVTAADSLATWD